MDLGGRRYVYREAGSRDLPALIALHGLISHAGAWDEFALALSDRYRVLSLDQRGHGASAWSSDYSQATWVDDVGLFADSLGLRRFTLVGHSMGGRIAWLYAAQHPERVERLVIVDIAPFKPNAWPKSPGQRFATFEEGLAAAREPRYLRSPESRFRPFIARHLVAGADGAWTWTYDPALRAIPVTQPSFAASVEDQWNALVAVACPTLVVATDLNPRSGREHKVEMVRVMRDAGRDVRLVDITDSGHDVLLEQPEALIAAVRGFLP